MTLDCQVQVKNREHEGLNLRSSVRYLKSKLSVGKEQKHETEYSVYHSSSANKTGTKYNVKNIKQVFVKCINEGKATIRFEEPPHDLSIKCEPYRLKCFMSLLKCCMFDDTKHLQISSLANTSVTAKAIAPKKLVILDHSDFPMKGLPRTLNTLYINGLNLCKFRREILLLKHLTVLDLSNNKIEKIPQEFGRITNLCELHMANNHLGINNEIDWRWLLEPEIGTTLKLLDLSGNHLTYLPKSIWKLRKLVTIKLDNNKLRKLPCNIGRISNLRYLTISQNELRTLPCSLMQRRLEYIDLSSNKFHRPNIPEHRVTHRPWKFCVESLVHIASRALLKCKIYYAPNIIPATLVDFLDNSYICVCGEPIVNKRISAIKEIQLKDYFRTVVFSQGRSSIIPFECYYCSPKCFLR